MLSSASVFIRDEEEANFHVQVSYGTNTSLNINLNFCCRVNCFTISHV